MGLCQRGLATGALSDAECQEGRVCSLKQYITYCGRWYSLPNRPQQSFQAHIGFQNLATYHQKAGSISATLEPL